MRLKIFISSNFVIEILVLSTSAIEHRANANNTVFNEEPVLSTKTPKQKSPACILEFKMCYRIVSFHLSYHRFLCISIFTDLKAHYFVLVIL